MTACRDTLVATAAWEHSCLGNAVSELPADRRSTVVRGVLVGDLGAYRDDVVFNWAAAGTLVAELRSLATVLDWQVGERRRVAGAARRHWTGVYGDQFDGRIGICTGDAGRFVGSMRDAANKLEELARLAREEQQRREQARAWVEQNDRNWLERNVIDPIFGEEVPEPPPPRDPPRIPIHDPSSAQARGPAVPVGGR